MVLSKPTRDRLRELAKHLERIWLSPEYLAFRKQSFPVQYPGPRDLGEALGIIEDNAKYGSSESEPD